MSKSFMMFWNWSRWLSITYSHRRWMLGISLPIRDKRTSKELWIFYCRNQRGSIQICRLENWCSCSSGTVIAQSWNMTCPVEPLPTPKHTVVWLRTTWNLHSGQNDGLFSSGVLLHHGDAALPTCPATTNLRVECPPHLMYSLDLPPSYVWNPQWGARWEEVNMNEDIKRRAEYNRVSQITVFSRNTGISEDVADLHWVWWELLESAMEFSVIFLVFQINIIRLLFDSPT